MKVGPDTHVAAITGASGGIGEQTAIGLVRTLPNLSKLFLCCRNTEKGETIAQSLRDGRVVGRRIDVTVVPVELADNRSVLSCASAIDTALAGESLDLLVCNAGIMAPPLSFTNNDGEYGKIESQFAVNHLSHALLTDRLLPALRKDGGRVVFVSSLAVSISRGRSKAPLISEKVDGTLTESNYAKWTAYGDSKLAMSLYAKGLAERESDVQSVSLHPGVVQTELARYLVPTSMVGKLDSGSSPGLVNKFFSLFGFKTPAQGAELSVEVSKAGESELDDGNMYVATGLKKINKSLIPLLSNEAEVEAVYKDASSHIENVLSSIGETSAVGGGDGTSAAVNSSL